jgi:adenylylsulfate kinase-like enzyme
VSDPYEEPLAPELVIDTEQETPEDSAARLVDLVEQRLIGASPVSAGV